MSTYPKREAWFFFLKGVKLCISMNYGSTRSEAQVLSVIRQLVDIAVYNFSISNIMDPMFISTLTPSQLVLVRHRSALGCGVLFQSRPANDLLTAVISSFLPPVFHPYYRESVSVRVSAVREGERTYRFQCGVALFVLPCTQYNTFT